MLIRRMGGLVPGADPPLTLCSVALLPPELLLWYVLAQDVTASELRQLVATAGQYCPILKAAREQAVKVEGLTGGRVPPYPGAHVHPTRSSSTLSLSALLPSSSSPHVSSAALAASINTDFVRKGSGSSQGSGRGSDDLPTRDSPNLRASRATWSPEVSYLARL